MKDLKEVIETYNKMIEDIKRHQDNLKTRIEECKKNKQDFFKEEQIYASNKEFLKETTKNKYILVQALEILDIELNS